MTTQSEGSALREAPDTPNPLGKIASVAAFLESVVRTGSRDVDDWSSDVQIAARTLQAALSALPAQEAQPDTLGYATRLAKSLHARFYADVTQWRPLPDLPGVLTQIDNMTCGLTRNGAAQEAQPADVARDAARYRWLREAEGDTWMAVARTTPDGLDREIDAAMGATPQTAPVAQPVAWSKVMRHVRRLQRHMDDWQAWYGRSDVLLRNQLPLPPAHTVAIMEDLDAAIAAAPAQQTRQALTDGQIDAACGPCDDSDMARAFRAEFIKRFRKVYERLGGISEAPKEHMA